MVRKRTVGFVVYANDPAGVTLLLLLVALHLALIEFNEFNSLLRQYSVIVGLN